MLRLPNANRWGTVPMPFPVPIFYSFNNHDAILPRGIFMPKTRKNKKGEPNERKENAADAKKTLESIPADYSALSGKVDENANGISELKEDLVDYQELCTEAEESQAQQSNCEAGSESRQQHH